ncbi:MAG: polysaccharide biosynthesis tyrosine autokinase [Pseudomonadota bacterium]
MYRYNPNNMPLLQPGSNAALNGNAVDVRVVFLALRRRLALLGLGAIAGLFLGWLAALMVPKQYYASAQLLVNPPAQALVDVEALEQAVPSQSFVDSQVELLRSRPNAQAAAQAAQLALHPIITQRLEAAAQSGLFSFAYWKRRVGFESASDDQRVDAALQREQIALAMVLEQQTIERVRLTDIISVGFASTDREVSAQIANAIAASYLERNRQQRLETIDEASSWLDGQIAQMRDDVVADENAVERYRAEKGLVNVSSGSLTDARRAEINRQLVIARTDLAEAEARLQRVETLVREGGDVETIAAILTSDTISSLRQEQAKMTRRRAELLARYGERHPSVVNVSAELSDINAQIQSEAKRIVTNLSNEVAVASSRLRSLRDEQSTLDTMAEDDEAARIGLRELERRANASRQLYETLLEGYQTSFVAGNAEALSPVALLVSSATAPLDSAFPNQKLFVAAGAMLGLTIAAAYALVVHFLDTKIHSLGALQERTGLQPLVSLPRLKPEDVEHGQLAYTLAEKPIGTFSESLKRLRSMLDIVRLDNPPKRIQITSALPHEGKTTTAIALASSYAFAGQKTVLVDFDLRRPTVYSRLGMNRPRVDLLAVLAKDSTLDEAIIKDENGVDYLLNARVPLDSADLIGTDAVLSLLDALSRRYDKVILDSAPVLPIVDSALLAQQSDVVIMCVMWDQTPAPAAAQAFKTLDDYGAYVAGGILTNIDPDSRQSAIGYGDGYDDLRYYKHYESYHSHGG